MVRTSVLAAVACVLLCSGCASIVSGTNQSLSVTTSSEGADVDGAKCALANDKGSWFVTSPGSVTVRRSFQDLMITCTLDGHDKAEQLFKSSTKGMVAGNVLIGGVIGIGVDVASGAAYDYPNMIAVAMTRATTGVPGAASPTAVPASLTGLPAVALAPTRPATPMALASVALHPGVRLTFLDLDPISQAPLGETTLQLVETTATQRIYNDGALVTVLDGTPVKGFAHNVMVYGLGPREIARGGTWSGKYRASSTFDDVPATFTVLRKQTKTVSGHRFEATRVRIEGYATRSGSGMSNGAVFNGEALVDNATGLILELAVTCRHPSYGVRRELVRVSGML
jgi:hypothetical protein